MCELGVSEYRRGKTHGTGMGIALQPAIATTVETAIHSRGCAKVTAGPKNQPEKERAHTPAKSQLRMQPSTSGEGVGEKRRKYEPYMARFLVIWDKKLTGGEGGDSHLDVYR
jgi:hypothetical protein